MDIFTLKYSFFLQTKETTDIIWTTIIKIYSGGSLKVPFQSHAYPDLHECYATKWLHLATLTEMPDHGTANWAAPWLSKRRAQVLGIWRSLMCHRASQIGIFWVILRGGSSLLVISCFVVVGDFVPDVMLGDFSRIFGMLGILTWDTFGSASPQAVIENGPCCRRWLVKETSSLLRLPMFHIWFNRTIHFCSVEPTEHTWFFPPHHLHSKVTSHAGHKHGSLQPSWSSYPAI